MSRFETSRIRAYYDRNTPAFVRLGQGGGAIHRAVWGPGVQSREEAFHYVEDQIALLVTPQRQPGGETQPGVSGAPHVVDLGCGVGASLLYLAGRLPIRGTGVTLSPVQARTAQGRIRAAGLSDRVDCLEGDYTNLPSSVEAADLAYAIEAFVHCADPAAFFAECHRIVRAGGLLAICDDFTRASTDRAAARARDEFCRGWHVNTLVSSGALTAIGASAGFEHVSTTELTPYLELGRPRDVAIGIAAALCGWLPLDHTRFGHLIGGAALQRGLTRGWLGYDLVVFRRS
jgi:SAM-dependent methyltransferase